MARGERIELSQMVLETFSPALEHYHAYKNCPYRIKKKCRRCNKNLYRV